MSQSWGTGSTSTATIGPRCQRAQCVSDTGPGSRTRTNGSGLDTSADTT